MIIVCLNKHGLYSARQYVALEKTIVNASAKSDVVGRFEATIEVKTNMIETAINQTKSIRSIDSDFVIPLLLS